MLHLLQRCRHNPSTGSSEPAGILAHWQWQPTLNHPHCPAKTGTACSLHNTLWATCDNLSGRSLCESCEPLFQPTRPVNVDALQNLLTSSRRVAAWLFSFTGSCITFTLVQRIGTILRFPVLTRSPCNLVCQHHNAALMSSQCCVMFSYGRHCSYHLLVMLRDHVWPCYRAL